MYEVTIAIPIYNVELYIQKSLESALSQTFQNIEYLVIDDKSTDDSIKIVREFQKEHPRGKDIRIIQNLSNKGIGESRNIALKEAKGKYLFFLDGDDILSFDCIEILYCIAINKGMQVVIGSMCEVSGKQMEKKVLPKLSCCNKDEYICLFYKSFHTLVGDFCINKLYLRSFLLASDIQFKAVRSCEDMLFVIDLLPIVRSIEIVPKVTYYHVKRLNSLSQFFERKSIPNSEVMDKIFARSYAKQQLSKFQKKSFFGYMLYDVMFINFTVAVYIIKHRKIITPSIPLNLVKEILSYPLNLNCIFNIKNNRKRIIFFYIVGKLPKYIIKCLLIFYLRILKSSN